MNGLQKLSKKELIDKKEAILKKLSNIKKKVTK
jgi:hypothetical protein